MRSSEERAPTCRSCLLALLTVVVGFRSIGSVLHVWVAKMKLAKRVKKLSQLLNQTRSRMLGRMSKPTKTVRVFADDVWLVSYPKSGNTWGRFLVGTLFNPSEPITFENLKRRVPDIYRHTDEELQKRSRPRLIKSHEQNFGHYPKTLYFVRDPRAVFVSYYYHMKREKMISDSETMDHLLDAFLSGKLGPFGRWDRHVQSWIHAANVLIVKYENLISKPRSEVQRMLEYLNLQLEDETIVDTIKWSSADHMRNLEINSPGSFTRQRTDIPFVRRALADNWHEELKASLVHRIEKKFARTMRQLGYRP